MDITHPVAFTALCKQEGLPEPDFEFQFHPTRKWRFDVAWPVWMLAIEFEGLVFQGGGRHQRMEGYTRDCEKYNQAVKGGWRVLRYTQKNRDEIIPDLKEMFGV